MKRIFGVLLSLLLLLQLLGCGGKQKENDSTEGSVPPTEAVTGRAEMPTLDNGKTGTEPVGTEAPHQPANQDPSTDREHPEELGDTTVMVYLLGSDLESKAGAGSSDLTEMAESGVDLECSNVLVYTGGSRHWHSEPATEKLNRLLRLTSSGFEVEAEFELQSMGEAECLAAFVNYVTENFPADHYALILWDHGSGPVIGYGKDMLFGRDTLTLSEMQSAMEQTVFAAGEQKLDWVGFDACLMASAELACIWHPYADYLVSSQETEPAFGWAYEFMSLLGTCDTPELLTRLSETYLQACRDYYLERGFDERDTTLSVLDLSCAAELHDSVNDLFDAALPDVGSDYDALAVSRSGTRALGRASTGSEYDLVDLKDLALRMQDRYPEESAALIDVIDRMVLVNSTNAEDLCGVSLYYPFFNKSYYTNSWSEIYGDMNVFESYLLYLKEFEQRWLGSDLLEAFSQSVSPSMISDSQYVMELTDDQAAHFSSAWFYILEQEGDEAYSKIFSSSEVSREGNRLIAHFDGNVIYGCSDYGTYFIPVTIQHDTVGNRTNYSAPVMLTNDNDYPLGEIPADLKHEVESYCFHLTLDRATGQVEVNALLPYTEPDRSEDLGDGKTEDADVSKWTTYFFNSSRHRTLSRYENGAVKPVDDWYASSSYTAMDIAIPDGIDFVFAPLSYGSYALVFEIQDTQGNRYCSEPLPIQVETQPELPEPKISDPEPITVTWPAGAEEVTIFETDGLRLFGTVGEDWIGNKVLIFDVENNTERDLCVRSTYMICNDNISCDDAYFLIYSLLNPKEDSWYKDSSTDVTLGLNGDLGMLQDLNSMEFLLDATDCRTLERVVSNQHIRIEFEPGAFSASASSYYDPARIQQDAGGAFAEEQVLLDNERMTVSLLKLGMNDQGEISAVVSFENHTDAMLSLCVDGIALNDVYYGVGSSRAEIYRGCIAWREIRIDEEELEEAGFGDVTSVKLCLRESDNDLNAWQGYGDITWLPVTLSRKANTPAAFEPGRKTLYEGNGIRLAMPDEDQCEPFDRYGYLRLTLENHTDMDISLDLTEISLDGKHYSNDDADLYFSESQVGAGQKTVAKLCRYGDSAQAKTVSFRLRVKNMTGSSELFESEDLITIEFP